MKVLTKDQVVEQWGHLIRNANGMSEKIFDSIETAINRTGATDVKVERQQISPGLFRGMLGGKRSFIVITNKDNPNLRAYKMYIGARDYGVNLQVSWYLVYQPGAQGKIMSTLLNTPGIAILVLPFHFLSRLGSAKKAGMLNFDIFDEQDLRAYVTNAQHCVLEAVEGKMTDLKQDVSRLNRQSKGFLGIVA